MTTALSLLSGYSSFIFWAAALVISVTIHEFSHALVADRLGDPTPRSHGRLTLNPLAHLDPIGTIALLLFRIGWGRPVPIDPFNFRNPNRDAALVSLAGPGSNMILAIVLSILIRFPVFQIPLLITFLYTLIIISVGLAIFNLIPVPPLDGSHIFLGLLSPRVAAEWEQALSQYGILILIFILFPFFGSQPLVNIIILPVINFILGLLLPGMGLNLL